MSGLTGPQVAALTELAKLSDVGTWRWSVGVKRGTLNALMRRELVESAGPGRVRITDAGRSALRALAAGHADERGAG